MRKRGRSRIWLFLFLKVMTGALAPFSYLSTKEYLKVVRR